MRKDSRGFFTLGLCTISENPHSPNQYRLADMKAIKENSIGLVLPPRSCLTLVSHAIPSDREPELFLHSAFRESEPSESKQLKHKHDNHNRYLYTCWSIVLKHVSIRNFALKGKVFFLELYVYCILYSHGCHGY